jgi:glycosyltransferase involved in cell wall biosynthesis
LPAPRKIKRSDEGSAGILRAGKEVLNILLIGNYPIDAQESMQRFAELLRSELCGRSLTVDLCQPAARLARRAGRGPGELSKWLGYADKFLLFPIQLKSRVRALLGNRSESVVHVCDHSNAMYLRHLQGVAHVITCHDLLAVRSALGEFPGHRPRWSGRILQRKILKGLRSAQSVVCDSEATGQDVLRLTGLAARAVSVNYIGLNYPYTPLPREAARQVISPLVAPVVNPADLWACRYLLHVGGNQWYKNRRGLLEGYVQLRQALAPARPPYLILAGKPITPELESILRDFNLGSTVLILNHCTNRQLQALYSEAALLLFPSLAEGFGWPILEAQACGCPVVTSNRAPMTEVGGEAAIYLDPENPEAIVAAVTTGLRESGPARAARIAAGLHNAARFSTGQMIDNYLDIYRRVIDSGPRT